MAALLHAPASPGIISPGLIKSNLSSPTSSVFSESANLLDEIRHWDEARVAEWLRSVNCGRYTRVFEENHITGAVLLEVDQNVVRELGITKVGDRVRLFVAIKALRARCYAAVRRPKQGVVAAEPEPSPAPAQPQPQPQQNLVQFIFHGHTKTVDISGCFNAESIIKKGIRKFGLKDAADTWTVFVTTEAGVRRVESAELVAICHTGARPERDRLILVPVGDVPSTDEYVKSVQIAREHESRDPRQTYIETHERQDRQTRQDRQKIRNFFGQRPPSELISSNLAEYFPGHESRVLEQTVRNSMIRRSKRISVTTTASFASRDSLSTFRRQIEDRPFSVMSHGSDNNSYIEVDIPESAEPDDDIGVDGGPTRWIKGALIGSGSFGSVVLGLNALTGELMAVKQVELTSKQGDAARKKSMLDALQREVQLLRDLHHENIVQYLGSNSDGQSLNIFLEYVPGGSVAALLGNYGPFEEPLIRTFVHQILSGLSYLHEKDIIHRDIKGANVLVDNKGKIKISDFGISKRVESGNHRPSLQGSVYWMAPEVVKQTSYTRKADIWSVGCLVVEMFTGTHPFPEFSQMQALFKIGTLCAPEVPKAASKSASAFLGLTFEFDYEARPSAQELLEHEFVTSSERTGERASERTDTIPST